MIELLRTRRSVRRFKDRPVSPEQLALLEEALLRAPSSRNSRPWSFVFVHDPALLAELARCKPGGAAFLAQAPLAVAICADPGRSDVWVEDCSIAAILLQLQAHALGLGSCWVQLRLRTHESGVPADERAGRILGLAPDTRVPTMVALGHPEEAKAGWPAAALPTDRISRA